MKNIEVLGTGCRKCISTEEMISNKANELGVEINLIKITDPVEIASRGILSTPAVVVDGKIVHRGSVPSSEDVLEWLK